jgi:hypothetical protein
MLISQDNIQPVMVQNSQQGSAEGDERLPDGMGVLSDFDCSEPESVAQVGHRLIDEYQERVQETSTGKLDSMDLEFT